MLEHERAALVSRLHDAQVEGVVESAMACAAEELRTETIAQLWNTKVEGMRRIAVLTRVMIFVI